MKIKIQIKSIDGDVLFEYEKENNTIKDTVEEAVKQNINLSRADLKRAVLIGADLRFADLSGAYLRGSSLYEANLHGANLNEADLSWAGLIGADLSGACLRKANINGADLSWAGLIGADLSGACLRKANINGAYLCGASLRGADFRWAKNVPYIPLNCPSEGAFIGWKKVEGKLVKLEIPEDAKRSSATSDKCRCDKAKVLSITNLDGSNPIDNILNTAQEHKLLYKVGEMVYPDSFDENRWNECSHGIHFFVKKQDAINY